MALGIATWATQRERTGERTGHGLSLRGLRPTGAVLVLGPVAALRSVASTSDRFLAKPDREAARTFPAEPRDFGGGGVVRVTGRAVPPSSSATRAAMA